jgi:hypothetical protein
VESDRHPGRCVLLVRDEFHIQPEDPQMQIQPMVGAVRRRLPKQSRRDMPRHPAWLRGS